MLKSLFQKFLKFNKMQKNVRRNDFCIKVMTKRKLLYIYNIILYINIYYIKYIYIRYAFR